MVMRFVKPDPDPKPFPRSGYVVVHDGPIEVGSQVRVAHYRGDGSPAEWLPGTVTAVDG